MDACPAVGWTEGTAPSRLGGVSPPTSSHSAAAGRAAGGAPAGSGGVGGIGGAGGGSGTGSGGSGSGDGGGRGWLHDGGGGGDARGRAGWSGGCGSDAGGSPGRTLLGATSYAYHPHHPLPPPLRLPTSASAVAAPVAKARSVADGVAPPHPLPAPSYVAVRPPPGGAGAGRSLLALPKWSGGAAASPTPCASPCSVVDDGDASSTTGRLEMSPLTSVSTPMVTARTSPVPSPVGSARPPTPAGSASLLFFPSTTYAMQRRARQHRAWVIMTLCAVLSTIGGILFFTSLVLPLSPATPPQEDPKARTLTDAAAAVGISSDGVDALDKYDKELLQFDTASLELEAHVPAFVHPVVPRPVPSIPLDRPDDNVLQYVSVRPSEEVLRSSWKSRVVAGSGESLEHYASRIASRPRSVLSLPMSASTPRPLLPGSRKGVPYRVRVIDSSSRLRRALRRTLLAAGAGGATASEWSSVGQTVVDLHGGIVGVGEYYTIVQLGGKAMRVQVDTGSATLAVPMKGCKSCVNQKHGYSVTDSPFAHAQAVACDDAACLASRCTSRCKTCGANGACCSTVRPKECGFFLRYADGSAASGSLMSDELQWGNLSTRVTFGGILNNSPDFERYEVDGILGMAYKSLACNPTCVDPPFDLLVASGLVDDVFSICMTAHGGKLVLGGMDERLVQSPVEWAPLFLSEPARYYRVHLGGSLKIGDEDVPLPNFRHAIVDTGTTLIVTSKRTFDAIRMHLQSQYCHVPELCAEDSWFQTGTCVVLNDEDLAKLPALTFRISGTVELTLRPQDYMLEYRRGFKSYRCVGIMGMDGLGGMVVLGNTLNQRYVAVYDRMNSRIGFGEARANCGMRAGKGAG